MRAAREDVMVHTGEIAEVRGRRRFPPWQAAAVAAALALAAALGPGSADSAGKLATTPSIWPAKGAVTSAFGWRNSPFGGDMELHQGLDIAAAASTPVVATADGVVVQSGPAGDYGNMVQLDHGDGLATVYGHNAQLAVSVGQKVAKGQVIAYSGNTGRSTGPHLHYEVRKNGTPVDPWRYLVAY